MWYRSLYRVLARARRDKVLDWFRGGSAVRPEVSLALGRHSTDAVWRSLDGQDLGGPLTYFVEYNWEFQKAFDHVDRGLLWKAAVEQGYPLGS